MSPPPCGAWVSLVPTSFHCVLVITEMERLLNTFCDLHISPFHNGYFSVGLVCGEHVMPQVPG